jgi:DNA-binding transcriptional regulator YiaG
MTITLKNLRCGECGHRDLIIQNVRNKWGMPWKDFPWVLLILDFELPVCPKCGNTIIPGKAINALNEALESSIFQNTSELLTEIKEKYHLTYKEIGRLTGVTAQYMSMLLNEKKVPSYQFVQLLRIMNKHPEVLDEMKKEWKYG